MCVVDPSCPDFLSLRAMDPAALWFRCFLHLFLFLLLSSSTLVVYSTSHAAMHTGIRTIHHLKRISSRTRGCKCKSKRLGIFFPWSIYSRADLMDGGEIKVYVLRELLISWSHEGPESNALVGLNILNEVICENGKSLVSVNEG